ncbi:MAG TPA: ABC transporter ATP-binding protein [Methylomirabilota bacterium]|nr:ABC transporter ATP-binding protein [Methylomirabilota bacterium]
MTKRFADAGPAAVDGVDLVVADGEFVAVLGPSGCGKTTLLRLIAGFETVDAGEIRLGGATVSALHRHVPPERRRVGVVFQTHALWPHMTVRRNVGYALEARGVRGAGYDSRVTAALATVGLTGLEDRRPGELSGGQRQRVALARCLAMEPTLVLLDEPLASLDVHLRAALQDEFLGFHRATSATMLYVTHDQAEAMTLADRIAVMEAGRLVQVAPPAGLYREPATAMVARFVGRGTVVPGQVLGPAGAGRCLVDILGHRARVRARVSQPTGPAGVCLRGEDLRMVDAGEPALSATVRRTRYLGERVAVDLEVAGTADTGLTLALPPATAPAPGTIIHLAIDDGWVIPA